MVLFDASSLESEEIAYRLFRVARDKVPWKADEIIRSGSLSRDGTIAQLAWHMASQGFYAEQAGLAAAASLSAATEDPGLRMSLALAAGDEARHADAFYQYAVAREGSVQEQSTVMADLDEMLTGLPHMGRALAHTVLEGFAADEFLLLERLFSGDPLGRIYHHIRADEIQHVAIGVKYLARVSRTAAGAETWRECADDWLTKTMRFAYLDTLSADLGAILGVDSVALEAWFRRRYWTRLKVAGVTTGREVRYEDQKDTDQYREPHGSEVLHADQEDQEEEVIRSAQVRGLDEPPDRGVQA